MAASALAMLAVMLVMFKVASAPSYTTMLTGLDPAETGKITAALDSSGHRATSSRTTAPALAVDKAPGRAGAHRARRAGASPARASPASSCFDKQKLGASDFQQQVTYQRALEGEIASTIGQIQGVSGAQVAARAARGPALLPGPDAGHGGRPAQQLGRRASIPPPCAASPRSSSSSVKGLKPANVTITDATGTLLWPNSDSSAAGGGGANKHAAQARYNTQLQAQPQRDARPDPRRRQGPGPGQRRPQRRPDDARQADLRQEGRPAQDDGRDRDACAAPAARRGGTTGSASNLPSYATSGAAGGNSNYQRKSTQTDFGVNKTVTAHDGRAGRGQQA